MKYHFLFIGVILLASPLYAAPSVKNPAIDQSDQAQIAKEPGACHFNPPEGWEYLDTSPLSPLVKIMVRGKGGQSMPPSLNLAVEETDLTLDDYVKAIKQLHQFDRQSRWSILGKINTGREVVITQLDTKTKWGEARILQAILVHEGIAYVLTATAHKDEFTKFSGDFLKAIRSFTVNKTVFEMVPEQERRLKLTNTCQNLKAGWKESLKEASNTQKNAAMDEMAIRLFDSNGFKTKYWEPFQNSINKDFSDLGDLWKQSLYKKMKNELLHIDERK